MPRMRIVVATAMTAVLLLPLIGLAQKAEKPAGAETYKVDPIHTSMWFRIKHLDVANFYGRFNEVDGTFTLDEQNAGACALTVEVKTASIDTNNADRDKHLKTAEYFDAEKYPTITFKSRSFKKAGDNAYEVAGELTLRGVTKPLTIKLERTGAADDPMGNHRAGLETTFSIQRSEFGLTAAAGALGEEVRLTVSIEGIRQ